MAPKLLDGFNIQLGNVVSDTFGKSSMKKKLPELQLAIDRVISNFGNRCEYGRVSDIQAFVLLAGLTPTNNESAGKKKSVRISRAGCYIKPLLVQCATAAVKSEKHPEIRNRYLQLKRRRGYKRAIIAIAHMLLTAIYHILKTKEPYNPELYKKSDVRPLQREITIEQAILLVQAQSYRILEAAT